jgi:hypothetical protein
MKSVFKLIEANGLTLHGDIEHFAELVRADEREQIALDKMAENARELGLDYEPVATLFGSLPVYDTPPAAPAPVTSLQAIALGIVKGINDVKLTEQPAPVQPMAHIVGEIDHAGKVWKPAQRQWVGLTDEEVKDIVWNLPYEPSQEHIRAIEAKLKERNNA